MNNNKLHIMTSLVLLAGILFSCGQADTRTEHQTEVKKEGLASVNTVLPQAAGLESYNNNCLGCHSASYVQLQPDLPEKTWTAIVTKMQKTFGAPIADSTAKEIVQYLVAVKGKS